MGRSYLVLLAIILLTVWGDVALKIAAKSPHLFASIWLPCGIALYGATAIGWAYLMQTYSLAQIGAIYSSATVIALALLGYFVFDENISIRQAIGMSAAVAAVVLVEG